MGCCRSKQLYCPDALEPLQHRKQLPAVLFGELPQPLCVEGLPKAGKLDEERIVAVAPEVLLILASCPLLLRQ